MKRIFSVVILSSLVLTISGCNLISKNSGPKTGQTVSGVEQETIPAPKGKGSESYTFKALKAAIELGIPLKCSYKINNVSYEGYVKGKQWRGKINFGDGKTGEVIMKGNCLYSWEENKNQGSKMCFDKDIWDTNQQGGDPNIEYICAPTLVDDGKFVPPTNINFVDLDQLQKQGTTE